MDTRKYEKIKKKVSKFSSKDQPTTEEFIELQNEIDVARVETADSWNLLQDRLNNIGHISEHTKFPDRFGIKVKDEVKEDKKKS